MYYSRKIILAINLACSSLVLAHSFVSNININGLYYDGFRPTEPAAHPITVGCQNAKGHAPISAGDIIHVQWNGWPESHKGPVLDYLASCGRESCETIDKNTLQFFKISQVGLVDGSKAPGLWGSDQLIANNNSWVVEIPRHIRPGFYVMRTEIIALHNASHEIGAQNYPQCINLQISGNGTELPRGVLGKELYDPEDPSLHLDISASMSTYKIPGPTLIAGVETVTLSHPLPTGSGTPLTGTETTSRPTSTVMSDQTLS
ncbi:glycoside hydrolase family 61 protein [Hypoxylon sp. FL1150]|nr:glycoside hydrolase family 61 protein [Hypoxylon sp. FL1150]